ncbi:hypothetical protein AACH06_01635 [Ideonella sp. DXS29W]|uniref:MSHA biogenesis protein MshK n=1 Tax=Ideonella lacteola TaxID=2984193 RepID=A0ABU9BID9_9BURK
MTRWFARRPLPPGACTRPLGRSLPTCLSVALPGLWLALMLGLAVTPGPAQAQAASATATAWADPTRPPAAAAEAGSAPRSAHAAGAASAPPAAAPQLQSLQVGTNGQASALVDGRFVQAGDAIGAARVITIDAEGLTLRDGQGHTQRLLLISAAIAKRDGGPAMPTTASSQRTPAAAPTRADGTESRPRAAVLTSGAATTAGTLGRGGREGQRP